MHPGVAPHPAAYGLPPGVDPYWAYHAQAQAAYAPPPYPFAGPYGGPNAGMAQAPWPGYGPGLEQQGGVGHMAGGGHGAGHRAGMSELVDEIANGGNGLSSLGKMLNFEDSEFWKGALLGAATVLLLTNESVQGALFKTGAKTKTAVKTTLVAGPDGQRCVANNSVSGTACVKTWSRESAAFWPASRSSCLLGPCSRSGRLRPSLWTSSPPKTPGEHGSLLL